MRKTLEYNQSAFTGFELADAAVELPKFFTLGLDNLPDSSIDVLEHLADSLLKELNTVESNNAKKLMVMDFISYGIYTGMLIREQRLAVDMIMYRNNTGLDN